MKQIVKAAQYSTLIFLVFGFFSLIARHPFRLPNLDFPVITVSWNKHSETYSMRTPYVRFHPLFTFKTEDFKKYVLPNEIAYLHDSTQKMQSSVLSKLIEEALTEIKTQKKRIKKRKHLSHFQVLQHKNFNYKKSCGLIVLKFNDYPLVVKLFLEQPSTFLDLHATGIEPMFFFYMGGGANRHLSGFTRIKNREAIIDKIARKDRWKDHVSVPRKWFWFPQKQKDMLLTAQNLAGHDTVETRIPGIYAVIADLVDMEADTEHITPKVKSEIIMQLCNDLDMFVDPHDKNYVFSQDKKTARFKITIVDTEHFPTMVGILHEKNFKNHNRWYTYLAGKCFHDMYLQTKRDLFNAQGKISALALM